MKNTIVNFTLALCLIFGTAISASAQSPNSQGNNGNNETNRGGASIIIQDIFGDNFPGDGEGNPQFNAGARVSNAVNTPAKSEENDGIWTMFLNGLPANLRAWLATYN